MVAYCTKEEIAKNIIQQTGAQSVALKPNLPIKEEVYPTILLNNLADQFYYQTKSTSGGVNFVTTQANKDFFITYMSLTFTKDASSDCTSVYIGFYNGGLLIKALKVDMQASTAMGFTKTVNLTFPAKCDRNTTISLYHSFTAGAQTISGTVGGFYL